MDKIKEILSTGIKNLICSSMPGEPDKDREPIQITVHNMIEFLFVIQGKSRYLLNQKLFTIEEGDMLIIDSREPHAFGYFREDHDLIHLWIHLTSNTCYARFGEITEGGQGNPILYPIPFLYDLADFLRRRCKMAREESGKMTESSVNRYLRLPLNLMLDEILITLEKKAADDPDVQRQKLVDSIRMYVHLNNGCHCSLSEIERYTGYNKYYISHLFKSEISQSIGEYVNDVRIKYTAEAELYGVKHRDIAHEIGFSSNSVFCQWLKRNKARIIEMQKSIQKEKEI